MGVRYGGDGPRRWADSGLEVTEAGAGVPDRRTGWVRGRDVWDR